jgi:DnaJ-class molecular chaperone
MVNPESVDDSCKLFIQELAILIMHNPYAEECKKCDGRGTRRDGTICLNCGGTGRVLRF